MIEDHRPERTVEAADRIADPLFSLSEDWRFVYCNDAAGTYLGASPDSLLGSVIWDRFPETRETAMPEEFHRAVETGDQRTFEVYHRPSEAWLSIDAYPEDGEGLTVLMREVTERKRRERDLRRRAGIVRAAGDPMFALDADGQFVEVNEALLDLTGRGREWLLDRHVSAIVDETDLADAERRLQSTLEQGGSTGAFDLTVETVHGDRRQCVATAAVLSSESGFEGTACVLRDVTDQKRRRQRLAVFDRVLRHNLRNELNKVLFRAEALQGDLEDPSLAGTAEGIVETARDLLSTSDQVRRFGEAVDPDVGERRPRPVAERVREVVEDVRSQYPSTTVHLRIRAEPWARGYASTFVAIEELVENAIEHVADPTVEVTVDATGAPGDGRVLVAVADDGPGLPEPDRRALVAGEESALNHASGLGLWLVNWTVEEAGGDVMFHENESGGSTVTVELSRVGPP